MISGTGTGRAEGWGCLKERQIRNDLLLNLPQIKFPCSVHFTISDPGSRFWRVLCWRRGPFSAVTLYQAASISSNHLLVNMPQWNALNSFECLALWFFSFLFYFYFGGKRTIKWNIWISYQLQSLILDLSISHWTILFENLNFLWLPGQKEGGGWWEHKSLSLSISLSQRSIIVHHVAFSRWHLAHCCWLC